MTDVAERQEIIQRYHSINDLLLDKYYGDYGDVPRDEEMILDIIAWAMAVREVELKKNPELEV